jgi:hypothetical protein
MARNIGRQGVTALLLGCALFLVSCANRPTAGQLVDSILQADAADDAISLTEDQAGCIADELLDSSLGDATLAGLAENFDTPNVLASDADDVEQVVADAAVACANA